MTEVHHNPDIHDATSVPALWAAARWFLRCLTSMCGTPGTLVAGSFLSLKERREILRWLRPVESLVRRLLVAEAARIARESGKDGPRGQRSGMKGRPPRPRFCRVSFPDTENPGFWAVRFALAGQYARRNRSSISPHPRFLDLDGHADVLAPAALERAIEEHRERMGGTEQIPAPARLRPGRRPAAGNPWPLAKRIEAVSRVLENPEIFARRLARRLRKNPERLFRVCRPPLLLPPDEPPRPAETCIRHASERALEALESVGRAEAPGRNPP